MKNMLVTDEKPAKLAQRFPAFFNKILLDAPCSGEGMFRKEEALARDWTPEKSAELSDIQKDLVLKAADMLRPGGMLLYSTCTFSPCEDEEAVAIFSDNARIWNLWKCQDMKTSPAAARNMPAQQTLPIPKSR